MSGRLESTLSRIDGKRNLFLSFRLNDGDRHPRIVQLLVEIELGSGDALPFSFQLADECVDRPFPVLRIVAGPGVSVIVPPWQPAPGHPAIDLLRVQDPGALPPLGSQTKTAELLGSHMVNPPDPYSMMVSPSGYPESCFRIAPRPDGVLIHHFFSGSQLSIRVPMFSERTDDRRAASARFAYEIDPAGALGLTDRPLLRIVRTPGVEIRLARGPTGAWARAPRRALPFWAIHEVDHPGLVPAQGESLAPQDSWRPVSRVGLDHSIEDIAAQSAFDASIGFVPVVGDLADLAEFAYGLATNRDRWGRKLETSDLALMGVAIVLPFVSRAGLRGAAALARRFGDRALAAQELIEQLSRAGLNREEAAAIEAARATIEAGRALSAEAIERCAQILDRVEPQWPSVDDLLNAAGTDFHHEELRSAYAAYRRQTRNPVDVQTWAVRTGEGPRPLLESILGPDFARRGRTRSIDLLGVVRPDEYGEELVQRHLEIALADRAKLFERVRSRPAAAGDALDDLRQRRFVNPGDFANLKGNLAEIFSMETQRRILGEIASTHPTAVLVTRGVRMRVMEGQPSGQRLFSDNIIAVEEGGDLRLLAVFEVKSGYRGGQEATEQIFRWIERDLTDHSRLEILDRAVMVAADGSERLAHGTKSFVYLPDRVVPGRIINLVAAERHIITAKGRSYLGVNSAMQVTGLPASRGRPRPPRRHELEVSSEQLDYLAARILSEHSR